MHRLWHIFVLGTVLLGVVSAALLAIVPLVGGRREEPEGFPALRRWLIGLVALAVVLVTVEWAGIH